MRILFLGSGLVVLVMAIGLLLSLNSGRDEAERRRNAPGASGASSAAERPSLGGGAAAGARGGATGEGADGSEHYLPASEVDPPEDVDQPPPPPPADTRDPSTYRPPMHNPNGVNGDRPPRPVPGLDE